MLFTKTNKDMKTSSKITNQEILNIVRNNQASTEDNYHAVKLVETPAQYATMNKLKVKKTQNYWNTSDWKVFCKEVKSLLAENN